MSVVVYDVHMATDTAPRCSGSNTVQSVEKPDDWTDGRPHGEARKPCTVCGQRVPFRVRGTDLPPWARILPHRTDGTPTR